eukprot:1627886-Karenia_brevis.AAC.1
MNRGAGCGKYRWEQYKTPASTKVKGKGEVGGKGAGLPPNPFGAKGAGGITPGVAGIPGKGVPGVKGGGVPGVMS